MQNILLSAVYFVITAFAAPICNNSTVLDLLPSTVNHLQLALFLENVEVEFFRSAVANLTTSDSQYGPVFNATVSSALKQEMTHQMVLKNIIEASGVAAVSPCQYIFPSYNTSQFLAVGRTLSVAGVGAGIALAGDIDSLDADLIPGIASIATTEARHSAFFESANGKIPNPAAFDTPIPSTWAFNLALGLAVPGSCPTLPPFPVLPSLSINISQQENGTAVEFSWDPTQQSFRAEGEKPIFIAWVNQMGSPIYTMLSNLGSGKGTGLIPKNMEGSVVVALTAQNTLEGVDDLSVATLAGPALLTI